MPGTPPPLPGEREVVVEQGPQWLGEFLIQPPTWFLVACLGVALAAAGVAWHVYQRDGVSEGAKREMAENALYAVCCGGATWALVTVAPLPYLVDVLGGVGVGVVITRTINSTRES